MSRALRDLETELGGWLGRPPLPAHADGTARATPRWTPVSCGRCLRLLWWELREPGVREGARSCRALQAVAVTPEFSA